MNAKTKKAKAEVPFDPVLFAATVPGRKPTPKELADTKENKDDAIEPQEYGSMEDMVKDRKTPPSPKHSPPNAARSKLPPSAPLISNGSLRLARMRNCVPRGALTR